MSIHIGVRRGVLPLVLAATLLPVAACRGDGNGATGTTLQPGAGRSASPGQTPSAADNGVAQLPGEQILDRAVKATKAAGFVRMHGSFRDGGQAFALDFRMAGDRAATGHMTVDGQRLDVIRIGKVVYLKGDDAYWRSSGGQAAVQLLHGKYLKGTTKDKDLRDFADITILSKFVGQLAKPEGSVAKGRRAQINGRPAIALTDAAGGELFVATTGAPHLLRLVQGSDQLDFVDYGRRVDVRPPAKGLVVDMTAAG